VKNSYRIAIVFAVIVCVILVAYYGPGSGESGTDAPGDGTSLTVDTSSLPQSTAMGSGTTTTSGTATAMPTGETRTPTNSSGASPRPGNLESMVGDIFNKIESQNGNTTPTTTAGATTSAARPAMSSGTATTGTSVASAGTTTAGTSTAGTARVTETRSTAGGTPTPGTGTARTTTASPEPTRATTSATVGTAPVQPRTVTPPPTATGRTYTIRSGDTLSTIAEDEYGSQQHWFEIAQANPTVDPAKLRIGQVIRLPALTPRAAATDTRPEHGPGSGQEYIVRPEDTLSSIARYFYNDPEKWRMLHDVNRVAIGADPNRLKVGMKLRIPPPTTGAN
jgi:nucleoid-associated protein YgaU